MKKLTFGLLALVTFNLNAQSLLDTVVVSASRLANTLQGSNRNVQILTHKDIEAAPVNSVAEMLDFVVGIDARQRGIFGTQTDLSIRGGTYEQVLVLVNGIRISDPQTGHHLMNLPVQKDDIERIEVLLGGASYIFGGSAFAGVINIITKNNQSNKTTINISAGDFNSVKLGITEEMSGKNHNTRISANHTRSDGFIANTDFENTNFYAQSNIKLKQQDLMIAGGYTDQKFGAQNFYSINFPEQYEKTKTLFVNATLESGDKVKLSREVYWRRNWDEFQLYREGEGYYQYDNGVFVTNKDTAAAWYGSHNYHRSDVLGGKIDVSMSSVLGKTSVGLDYRFEKVVSNNLGTPLENTINIEGSRGFYHLGADRHNISIAGEHLYEHEDISISLGAQLNYNSDYNSSIDDLDFYPAITAGYNLDESSRVYASYNSSFRLPSYTDLYYSLGGAVGSEDLLPENSQNFELGYRYTSKKISANASGFMRQGRDIIDWLQSCDTCDVIASNTSKVDFFGAELSLNLFDFNFMKSLAISNISLGYSYLTTDDENVDYQSVYVYDYMKHKAVLRVNHQFIENLSFNYSISYQDRAGTYTNAETGEETEYENVLLLNAQASYDFGFAELYISAQNLLNKTYYDRGNIQLPGLWAWAGLRLSL